MATEQELERARRAHAESLADMGRPTYPNTFRAGDDVLRRRAELLRLVHDPAHLGAPADGEEIKEDQGSFLKVTAVDGTHRLRLKQQSELREGDPRYPLFGRVIARRGPFLVIQTPHGDAQAYIPDKGARLSEIERAEWLALDLADHIAVEGPLMGTRSGQGAIWVERYEHVAKALLPPPAKYHGLKDIEKRYRERYVDLFASPSVRDVFEARALIVRSLRRFLDARSFLEVETPMLQSVRGGATARPFTTHHNALDMPLYMRVAPELYLKRLLVGGFDRVYELGRNFRNEGVSTRHNPEFTMLEFYMAYANYEDMMDLCESLLRAVDEDLSAHSRRDWRSARKAELQEPFARVTMVEAIQHRLRADHLPQTPFHGRLDAEAVVDEDRLAQACDSAMADLSRTDQKLLARAGSHGERVATLFELVAEPTLCELYRSDDRTRARPVFITRFPSEVSPLARRNDADPSVVDRFELFVDGRELINAFSELNDPDDQAARFQAQLQHRDQGDEEAMDFDADYIRALMHGMPPATGAGIGVDRLTMTLCNQSSIRDVLLFPLMRKEAG